MITKRYFTLNKILLIFVFCLCFYIVWFLFIPGAPLSEPPVRRWGVTYSPTYASYLGLDWKKTYLTLLNDLGVKNFRLVVPWDEIEPKPGEYNFSNLDWMLELARTKQARVLLAIGLKTPRWPECRMPEWVKNSSVDSRNDQVLKMLTATVKHFQSSEAIEAWQVENEPLFYYGDCPKPDEKFLRQEIALVRSLDSRPIVITDSGELSSWLWTAPLGDMLGVSVYRRTWNPLTGYLNYPLAPALYARKARLISSRVGRIMVTELQMEPWSSGSILKMSVKDQTDAFSVQDFRANVDYVKKIGFDTLYLWGAEWWVQMRDIKNQPEFYNEARQLFKNN